MRDLIEFALGDGLFGLGVHGFDQSEWVYACLGVSVPLQLGLGGADLGAEHLPARVAVIAVLGLEQPFDRVVAVALSIPSLPGRHTIEGFALLSCPYH
ncbi:hypothetical protein [Nocardia sp. CA-119907]|uniref:hypothetical protein n=1 Tax=Nocardia sp. CA-119907 TaxID=3239973 RepID=UPI003D96DCEB